MAQVMMTGSSRAKVVSEGGQWDVPLLTLSGAAAACCDADRVRPWVILVLGALFAGLGFGAAKLWRATQDGPCANAPEVAAADVLGTRGATPVRGGELDALREGLPQRVRRAYLPADAADSGRGASVVRVTVLVSADEAVDGEAFAQANGLADGAPVAIGDGTGRLAESGRTAVAVGALDGCTGAIVAGGSADRVRAVAEGLRSP
jgi:hypothetical protein